LTFGQGWGLELRGLVHREPSARKTQDSTEKCGHTPFSLAVDPAIPVFRPLTVLDGAVVVMGCKSKFVN